MKLTLTTIFFCALLAIGAPLAAAQPDNLLESDGCDVMQYVEALDPGTHSGVWVVESIFSGESYTYIWDATTALTVFAPDGLSMRLVQYVSWRLVEAGAKGTNRTEVTADLTQPVYSFDGQIIRGTKFPKGGIGGHGTYDPTGVEPDIFTQVDLVFCQGHK